LQQVSGAFVDAIDPDEHGCSNQMKSASHRDPLVSLVVPLHNAAPFIEATMASVVSQGYDSWEAIVVNDGSTDRSSDAMRRYLDDPRISIIHQSNAGVSCARNRAMHAARGAYLMFLDADDLLVADWLQVALQELNKFKADVVVPKYEMMTVDGLPVDSAPKRILRNAWDRFPRIPGSSLMRRYLLCGLSFPPSGVLVRRDLKPVQEGMDPELHGTEDTDFWLRLAESDAHFYFASRVGVRYRRHGSSASAQLPKMEKNLRLLYEKAFARVPEAQDEGLRDLCWALLELKLGRRALKTGDREEWLRRVDEAVAILPKRPPAETVEIVWKATVLTPGAIRILRWARAPFWLLLFNDFVTKRKVRKLVPSVAGS